MARLTVFQFCLLGSAVVHSALLAVRFVDPATFDQVFKDHGLEVILVNAQGNEKVDKAKAIAQFTLDGGGSADKGRATSPLQADRFESTGDATEDVQQHLDQLQTRQTYLLAQLKDQLVKNPTQPLSTPDSADNADRVEKARQRLKQIAEIERRVVQENERPKKRFVSPSTVGKVHALYYHGFKRKVEDLGTRNFPAMAGKKLYGDLTMSVSLDRYGQVIEAQIITSTGNSQLDKMAQAIVYSGAPYGTFTDAMLKKFQILVIVSRFSFTRDDGLQTTVVAQ
jgi:periplasmic protein TonB